MPTVLLIAQAAATLALVGLIWTVQVVLYPLFAQVGREAFPAYHAAYLRRMTMVVAPLMLVEAAAALLLWLHPPAETCPPMPIVGAALVAVVWLSTLLVQVPYHRRLEPGFDDAAWRGLVKTNWVRTIAWTARGGLALAWLLRVL